jgi:hypothetical protein
MSIAHVTKKSPTLRPLSPPPSFIDKAAKAEGARAPLHKPTKGAGAADAFVGTRGAAADVPMTTASEVGGTSLLDVRLGRAAGARATKATKGAKAQRTGGPPTALPVGKLSSIETRGASGAVFQLDHSAVQGQRVNVRRIEDEERGPGLELNFKLRAGFEIDKVVAKLRARDAESARFKLTPMEPREDGTLALKPGEITFDVTSGGTVSKNTEVLLEGEAFHLEGKGFTVDVLGDTAPQATKGKLRLRVFGASDKELERALKAATEAAALGPALAELDPESETKLKAARLLWQTDPKLAQKLHESDIDATSVAALKAWCEVHGISPVDVTRASVKEVFPGHITVMNPAQAERYKELGVEYVFAGVGSKEAALAVLGSDGLMSSEERMSRGVFVAGLSTWEDFRTGGADYVFTRMATKDAAGVDLATAPFAGSFQIAYRPEVLARTDWFGYSDDKYGNTRDPDTFHKRKYGEELIDSIGAARGGFSTGNEVMFQRGLSNDDVMHVFTQSEQNRAALLQDLNDAGVSQIGGRPLEEVVVVRQKMVELTDELLLRKVDRQCQAAALAFTPALEKAVQAAVKKLGAEGVDPCLADSHWSGLESCLSRAFDDAGVKMPALSYDQDRLKQLLAAPLEQACLTMSPELEAILAKLTPAKIDTRTLTGAIDQLSWNGEQALAPLAKAAGVTMPTLRPDADALIAHFKTTFANADLAFTPQVEAFVRAAAESGKVGVADLRRLSDELRYGDTERSFKDVAKRAGVEAPLVRFDEGKALEKARQVFSQQHLVFKPAHEALLQQAVAGGNVEAIRELLQSYGSPASALERLAKATGTKAPPLVHDEAAILGALGKSMGDKGLAMTPAVQSFFEDALKKGATSADLTSELSNRWIDPATFFGELARTWGLKAPSIELDPKALQDQWRNHFQGCGVVFDDGVAKLLEAAAKSGKVSAHDARNVMGAITNSWSKWAEGVDPEKTLKDFAQRAGVPPPTLRMDKGHLQQSFRQRFEQNQILFTPEVKARLDELAGKASYFELDKLSQNGGHPGADLKLLLKRHGLADVSVQVDKNAVEEQLRVALQGAGVKLDGPFRAFVDRALDRGVSTQELLDAAQDLSWYDPEQAFASVLQKAKEALPRLTLDDERVRSMVEQRFSVLAEPYTPELKAFVEHAVAGLPWSRDLWQRVSNFPWYSPSEIVDHLAAASGKPAPAMG